MAGLEGAFLCLGNPLLDISSKVDAAFLDKYEVRPLALKGNGHGAQANCAQRSAHMLPKAIARHHAVASCHRLGSCRLASVGPEGIVRLLLLAPLHTQI